ncbi:class I SAM-dependent methyltransferase [bacterium]|nr:class I SAM-dependent methyltransferase [bacterium]
MDKPVVKIGQIKLIICRECCLWNYYPRPTKKELLNFYNSKDYYKHPYFKLRRNNKNTLERRCRFIFNLLSTVVGNHSWKGERILDVGCDMGGFLHTASRLYGVEPIGIDVVSQTVEHSKNLGIEAYQTEIEQAPMHLNEFSLITAIDLIEHVLDPVLFFQNIHNRLRPGGYFYLETPNVESMVYQTGRCISAITNGHPRGIFQRLFPPEHLEYYTIKSMQYISAKCGLEILSVTSRSLQPDEIAVSYLIKAFVSGLQSFDLITGNKSLLCCLFRRST